jgi:hypothetical protein
VPPRGLLPQGQALAYSQHNQIARNSFDLGGRSGDTIVRLASCSARLCRELAAKHLLNCGCDVRLAASARTSPKDVSSGSSAIGARRFQAITSTIQAADKLRQHSLCWSKRCITAVQRKKLGLTLHSEKSDGERVYRVIDNDAEPSAA